MTFAQWQASRGIMPWNAKPQHFRLTLDHLSRSIARASDSFKEFGECVERFAQMFNSIKEDI